MSPKHLSHPSPQQRIHYPVPRPTPALRRALYLATLLIAGSGYAWLVAHYLLPLPEFAARHPLETWSIRLHGAAAMLALAVFGALWQQHIGHALRQRRYFRSGVALLAGWLLLIASGYGLYYLTDEALRATFSQAHWLLGLALPLALAAHIAHAFTKKRR
jgi:hypothetical protein